MSKVAVIGLIGNSAFLSVDEFHKGGETIVANDIHFEPGGKGFNQAVAVARMGVDVSFLGAVGKDYFQTAYDFCSNENIKSFLVQKEESTAYASIITDNTGETRVTVYQGASLNEKDVEIFASEIIDADILLINNEVSEEVNKKALLYAKEGGTKVILNPAPSRPICSFILDNVDIFTPNQYETEYIANKDNLIITMGKQGCYLKWENETFSSHNSGKVVDTTGAGDTFNGVLAAYLAQGKSIKTAIKCAIIASGISVTKKYAVSSIPTENDINNNF